MVEVGKGEGERESRKEDVEGIWNKEGRKAFKGDVGQNRNGEKGDREKMEGNGGKK